MKVFVTGGSGFIGTTVIHKLLKAGHEVVGLARSEESAAKLESMGPQVTVVRGELGDLEVLKKAASEADGVIHLGFVHDFSKFIECCEIDQRATVAMLESLEGSNKAFVYTNGTLGLPAGKVSDEKVPSDTSTGNVRSQTEAIALSFKEKGVNVTAVRLPPTVHGPGDKAFMLWLIGIAKRLGKSGYIGNGENVWPAVNRLDTGDLYRLVLEKGTAGSVYHAVAEQGIKTKDIAKAIGDILDVPVVSINAEDAQEQFGFLGMFFGKDSPASSEITRKELGWKPHHPALLEDLRTNYRL
ncbi:LANO_0G07448g1_1 [Lachancea nothofagi CBS 11611]|uniref:LANO_0G07448g1_1 n=1 Tax=Lachancea nothofagi CBS 11611 TaxID=1266666 RepID=A0A1G4KHM0_9SACH|nr:LANO_0G07448g1_1 [Lachancea nothofagi CBS 11611]